MNIWAIIIIAAIILLAIGVMFILLFMGNSGGLSSGVASSNTNLRNLIRAQRDRVEAEAAGKKVTGNKPNLAVQAAAEGEVGKNRSASSRLTLEKQLKYAQLDLTVIQFRGIQAFITISLLIPAYLFFPVSIVFLSFFMGTAIPKVYMRRRISKRFNAFDKDYPVMLLSYVSLLKTGMNTLGGLEAAAKGLDEDSMVRVETELMLERLRLGLTEEQAIGAFGEDVPHPEIELFVQSLVLSRRVGGSLSNTLERLAKQVRRRQEFRKKALAAVGLEKSSMYFIAVVMTGLMIFLWITSPELIKGAFMHETGKMIFSTGVTMIILGLYWAQRVTDIKV